MQQQKQVRGDHSRQQLNKVSDSKHRKITKKIKSSLLGELKSRGRSWRRSETVAMMERQAFGMMETHLESQGEGVDKDR